MRVLHLVSLWVHLFAAIVWIGGMAFLAFVAVPALRKSVRDDEYPALLERIVLRFRTVGWIALGLLLVTGLVQVALRGHSLAGLVTGSAYVGPLGGILLAKVLVFVAILALSSVHDFRIGPRALKRLKSGEGNGERLRRLSSHIGRATFLLALVMVALGLFLVRGLP